MKRIICLLCTFISVSAGLYANENILSEADRLFEDENYINGLELLEDEIGPSLTETMQAEIYWRMSRFLLHIADDRKSENKDKDKIIELYQKGMEAADKAISLRPDPNAYYYRASNTGRYAKMKGILSSLSKAKPMREDLITVISLDSEYADAFFVLGKLYFLVPGWPISFGNKKKAVSFTRRAITIGESAELKFMHYASLAEMLWDRDWNIKTKEKRILKMETEYQKSKTEFDRMSFYESRLGFDYLPVYCQKTIGNISDREEAMKIVEWLRKEFSRIENPGEKQIADMKELEEISGSWNL